ncbi:MAG TPA: hypothetical protein VEH81_10360 [Ktedonobacteraceae bacterium]|nr:hypothetical protein [Ktedonobacteraceae bacterium]
MNQQEFEMGSQSNQQNSSIEEDEIHQPQYPYSWSDKINTKGVPRDEPPSSYDSTVMQQGYQAQTSNAKHVPGPQQAQVKDLVCHHGHDHNNTHVILYDLHLSFLFYWAWDC